MRKTETENPHSKELEEILFRFIDDEMDYNMSDDEIMKLLTTLIFKAIDRTKNYRLQTGDS